MSSIHTQRLRSIKKQITRPYGLTESGVLVQQSKRMDIFLYLYFIVLTLLVHAASSFTIQPKTWTWRGHSIAYDQAQTTSTNAKNQKAILLLNGFGVGSFHQHRLISQLLSHEPEDSTYIIYAVDYLGQGKSWPMQCQDGNSVNEVGLQYSADMWLDQLQDFIEHHVPSTLPLHVVGNSVGGYLAVALAHRLQALNSYDRIASLVLLNATPVWGLNLPGWSGHLPAPAIPKWIGRRAFDWIRSMNTIDTYLQAAYHHREAFEGDLPLAIRSCTEGNGGHAAFASIMWSPPASGKDWFSKLSDLSCDCLFLFGARDPWCTPAFAKKMIQALPDDGSIAKRYLELDNVGHCPNHEAPTAVASAISAWMHAADRRTFPFEEKVFVETWGDIRMQEKEAEEIPLNLLDWFAVTFV